jgi:hypothetical protein
VATASIHNDEASRKAILEGPKSSRKFSASGSRRLAGESKPVLSLGERVGESEPAPALEERVGESEPALSVEERVGESKPALSLGERVSRDGAFSSRCGTGEGLLPLVSRFVWPRLRIGMVQLRACIRVKKTLRKGMGEMSPTLATDPSPVTLRLMTTPERATLSPKGEGRSTSLAHPSRSGW